MSGAKISITYSQNSYPMTRCILVFLSACHFYSKCCRTVPLVYVIPLLELVRHLIVRNWSFRTAEHLMIEHFYLWPFHKQHFHLHHDTWKFIVNSLLTRIVLLKYRRIIYTQTHWMNFFTMVSMGFFSISHTTNPSSLMLDIWHIDALIKDSGSKPEKSVWKPETYCYVRICRQGKFWNFSME